VLCEAALSIAARPGRFLSRPRRVRRPAGVHSVPPSSSLWSSPNLNLLSAKYHELRTNFPEVFVIVGCVLDASCVCKSPKQGAHRGLWRRHGQITKRNRHIHRSVATGEQRVLLVLSTCTGTLQLLCFTSVSSSFHPVRSLGENSIRRFPVAYPAFHILKFTRIDWLFDRIRPSTLRSTSAAFPLEALHSSLKGHREGRQPPL